MKITDDQVTTALDWAWDAVHVVVVAGLLGFVAYAWKLSGLGVAWTALLFFASAYMVGRWHAGKDWQRDVGALSDRLAAVQARLEKLTGGDR